MFKKARWSLQRQTNNVNWKFLISAIWLYKSFSKMRYSLTILKTVFGEQWSMTYI